jgi:hypothetical protein
MAQYAERYTRCEKNGRQDRGGPGYEICGPAPGHEAAAPAANSKRAALRPLEKDQHDHGDRDRNMNDKKNSGHDLTDHNVGEATVI